jgi:Flp pilus assembly protein TadG
MARSLLRRFRDLLRHARAGSTAIEFALLAPVLCLFLIGLIETGAIYYLNSTLTNAANDTARMVRTGQVQSQGLTKVQYIAQICTEMTGMISAVSCNANLQVDMEAFSSFQTANYTNVVNADGSLNIAAMQFVTGNSCDTVLVRAFYPWTIMTPLMKPLLKNMPNGQYLMSSAAAFRNEPFVAGASC